MKCFIHFYAIVGSYFKDELKGLADATGLDEKVKALFLAIDTTSLLEHNDLVPTEN